MLKRLSGRKVLRGLVKDEDSFNRFFSSFFDEFLSQNSDCECHLNSFKVDILEDELYYWLEADLPGFTSEEIKINYEHHFLTITAQSSSNTTHRSEQFIRKERQQGIYSRTFQIEDILESQIEQHLRNGLLTIKIPKDLTRSKSNTGKDEMR